MIDNETLEQLSGDERLLLALYAERPETVGAKMEHGPITMRLWAKGLLVRIGTTLTVSEAGREILERTN